MSPKPTKTNTKPGPGPDEIRLLRQQLKAIRERVSRDLDAIDAHLCRLLPEAEPRHVITDGKKEVQIVYKVSPTPS